MRRASHLSVLAVALSVLLTHGVATAQADFAIDAISSVKPAVVMLETNNSWGTGFFVSRDGYLLTNNHVVQDSQRVTVIYRNKERLEANVVAVDALNDLAVLKVNAAQGFLTVRLGDSDEVQEGTPIAVTGYPKPGFTTHALGSGIQACTARGIVSANRVGGLHGAGKGRAFLQYDASSLHGNSGGPVYRLDSGEVIAVVCIGGSGNTFNFGVPINEAKLLLQKAGVLLQPSPAVPGSPETAVEPGDVSMLNTVGPDKALTSLLATSEPLSLDRTQMMDRYEQLVTNAGYLSCYGQMAPQISAPVAVNGRLVMTAGTGQVVVYDPRYVSGEDGCRSLFNVESGYLFCPPASDQNQIVFSSGTPTFAAKEKVDTGRAILAILAAAAGSPGGSVTKIVPTLDAEGSIFAVNPTSGSPYWEYKAGYTSTPVLVGDKVYFGGMGVYGALEAATGRELWVKREKLGSTGTRWYSVDGDGKALYVLVSPIKSEFSESFPGFCIRGDGMLTLIAVSVSDGKQLWKAEVCDTRGENSPLAVGIAVDRDAGRIYLTRNDRAWAYALDGKELWVYGEKPKQERRRKPEEKEVLVTLKRLSTSFAFDDDSLYLGGDDGKVYCLNARTGAQRWVFTGLRGMGDPALYDGTLYCGSKDGWMYALNPADGQLKWKVHASYSAVGKPLLNDGILYFSTQGGEGFASQLQMVFVPPAAQVSP